jgi:hypothetical protein
MQDATTLFEMEVLTLLKQQDEYKTRFVKPILIGPDRGTVQHTLNTVESYSTSLPTEKRAIRRDYRKLVDIVGTQARYADDTARLDNYLSLTQD